MRLPAVLILAPTALFFSSGMLWGAEAAVAEAELFEKQVRPVLANHCYDCHSSDYAESELQVDSLAGLLRGGARGPAIVPGEPERSLLLDAVKHSGQLFMPPKEKISQGEINALSEWIKRGAHWPGEQPVTFERKADNDGPLFTQEDRNFWAFQQPQAHHPPVVENPDWVRSPLDAFILARLEEAELSPAPQADKLTLIRRATFDLTGLPPTPEEVDQFLADESDEAFADLVERLLASPQYGVRWARHWLDVARYADSNGLDENLAYAHAYRYRDYVVDAFNQDKPYDRFVQEQIAGDLLQLDDVDERIAAVTATGFLSIGAKMLAEDDPVKMQMDIVDEQVDTVGRAFMGLTFGCARCHDHKFDPIPTADYYSLAGIFKSTKTMENFSVVARWHERPLGSESEIERQRQQQLAIDEAQKAIDRLVTEANESLQRQAREHLADYLLAAEYERQRDAILKDAQRGGASSSSSEEDSDSITIEAENFTRGNVRKDFDGYGKGIGIILNGDELPNQAEWEFSIDEPGLYQLELRYAAAEARPCQLSLNGVMVKSDAAPATTGSWNPDTQQWFVELIHEFSIGTHRIGLRREGPFPHFDRLRITPLSPEQRNLLAELSDDLPYDQESLHPAFVQQWKRYLEQTKDDPTSPFAAWHALVNGEQLSSLRETGNDGLTLLLGDPRPENLAALAERYQEIFLQVGSETPSAREGQRTAFREIVDDAKGPFAIPKDVESLYPTEVADSLAAQQKELKQLQEEKLTLPTAMAVTEGKPEDIPIHIRGSHVSLGEVVPRRFPQILTSETNFRIGEDRSGRLELARWMTEPDHPLTSRVMANRLWQWHFGEGLVRTPDNFGQLGERPTHPELLDWLARQFVQSGWSIKAMHRLIMLSSTYQMSTAYNAEADVQDPENRLWWRRNRRRLEAEAIRDSILAVAGNLDLSMGGSLLPTANRAYVTSTANVDPVVYTGNRRSLYLPVVRSAVYDVLQAFDFADPSYLSGQRMSTTVAPQALFMMNSQLVAEHTRVLAEQMLKSSSRDDAARVESLYRQVLSRPPTLEETAGSLDYVHHLESSLESRGSDAEEAHVLAWQSLCRTMIASNEFIFVE